MDRLLEMHSRGKLRPTRKFTCHIKVARFSYLVRRFLDKSATNRCVKSSIIVGDGLLGHATIFIRRQRGKGKELRNRGELCGPRCETSTFWHEGRETPFSSNFLSLISRSEQVAEVTRFSRKTFLGNSISRVFLAFFPPCFRRRRATE